MDSGDHRPGQRPPAALRLAVLLSGVAMLAGCAPSALAPVRRELAAGQWAAARAELLALEARPQRPLSESELREAKGDLCLAEFMLGAPAYPLSEQRRVCAAAGGAPGSRSRDLLRMIDDSISRSAARRVEHALSAGDLSDAEQAALVYEATPGADPAIARRWARRMREIAREWDWRGHAVRGKRLAAAVAELRRLYPRTRRMETRAFLRWAVGQGRLNGVPIVSAAALRGESLELSVPAAGLRASALHVDRFGKINDALVARCGCDGLTYVAAAETRFPLYLVRLDPETRRSEVVILPRDR